MPLPQDSLDTQARTMASTNFGGGKFILRLVLAVIVVFSTYNPEGYSYYHWAIEPLLGSPDELSFSVFKAFVGVVLLIGWVILIRATVGSLGVIGIALASLFFGLLIWLIIDFGGLDTSSLRVISYIIEVVIIGVLSIGVSWSHIRRRITGQIDIDNVED